MSCWKCTCVVGNTYNLYTYLFCYGCNRRYSYGGDGVYMGTVNDKRKGYSHKFRLLAHSSCPVCERVHKEIVFPCESPRVVVEEVEERNPRRRKTDKKELYEELWGTEVLVTDTEYVE